MQCSVNWNHSLLTIYAQRWFIKFAHFITSLTFLFEFTDGAGPSQKRSQSSLSLNLPRTVYGCVCGVSIAVVQFPSMNFPLQLDFKRDRSFLRNIKADTHEGFCSRSMPEAHFARPVHTRVHTTGACFMLWYTRGSKRKKLGVG